MSVGNWNNRFGWLLLTLVFAASGGLDPWSFSQRNPDEVLHGLPLLARHAQAVVIGMAFLQLLLGRLLAYHDRATTWASWVAILSILGSIIYAVAYLLFLFWPATAYFAAFGAALNAGACFLLLTARYPSGIGPAPRVAVVVLCSGMLLDVAMALGATEPGAWGIGPIDGVPMRMLRLARAAIIALSLISLLFAELLTRARPVPRLVGWATPVLVAGATGMPILLVLSAFLWMPFKNLLGLPANATLLGVVAAIWLSVRHAGRFELAGWIAIALSMSVGLLMGLYAFDGPVPVPGFIGSYNDYTRRLTRLGHAYTVVFGLILICLQRDLATATQNLWLVMVGAIITVVVIAAIPLGLTPYALALGPAIVTAGLVVCSSSLFRAAAS